MENNVAIHLDVNHAPIGNFEQYNLVTINQINIRQRHTKSAMIVGAILESEHYGTRGDGGRQAQMHHAR